MTEKKRARAMRSAIHALESHGFTIRHVEVERAGVRLAAGLAAPADAPEASPEPILDDATVQAQILDMIAAANRLVDGLQRGLVNFQAVARGLDFDFDAAMERVANDAEDLAQQVQQLRRQAR
jgi:hypothetical protein